MPYDSVSTTADCMFGIPVIKSGGFLFQDRLPTHVFNALSDRFNKLWAAKEESFVAEWNSPEEAWSAGCILHRSWTDQTIPLDLSSPTLILKNDITFHAFQVEICAFIHARTGLRTEAVRVHGPRIYQLGAILKPHIDKYNLTAIIHLASESSAPWPLVLETCEGRREAIMSPGEILVFDGCKIPHGRPLPLREAYYASYFIDLRQTA